MYDLIIIGGGPAGITAGIYAARKKLNTLLISKDFVGQTGTAFGVENYTGFEEIRGLELMKKFKNHLEKFEIKINEFEEVKEIKKINNIFEVKTDEEKYSAKTIIVTSGRNPKTLEVSGEKEFLGRGVSYCVTCDETMVEGKIAAVIGGGNVGLEAGLELTKFCKKIYIIEYALKVTGDEILQKEIENDNKISVITDADVKKIKGDSFVEKIIYEDGKSKKINQLTVDGVFIEIGAIPSVGFAGDLVELNDNGEIKINPRTCATKTDGLFAAGDVADTRDKQIITACGEGAKSALSVYEYLKSKKLNP
ncbi:MAG: FAD-dependent oxidoreductase [Candidatus Pacebacteria bacterium]|nr:FAD-dependent oxidoreductase [Candidatus Paceibacterota bacterium]